MASTETTLNLHTYKAISVMSLRESEVLVFEMKFRHTTRISCSLRGRVGWCENKLTGTDMYLVPLLKARGNDSHSQVCMLILRLH